MIVYADTSFLTAVYLRDTHSREAYRRMADDPNLAITPFSRAELANAFYRQVFLKRATTLDVRLAWENFESDCHAGLLRVVELPESAWSATVDLARRYGPALGVRTLDSLHVACAIELRAERFWTFDERQKKLAETVGLDTTA
ncbi:MAG: type II toxin-antitoxin system VapC family toxin [Terracidiphilus sp.]